MQKLLGRPLGSTFRPFTLKFGRFMTASMIVFSSIKHFNSTANRKTKNNRRFYRYCTIFFFLWLPLFLFCFHFRNFYGRQTKKQSNKWIKTVESPKKMPTRNEIGIRIMFLTTISFLQTIILHDDFSCCFIDVCLRFVFFLFVFFFIFDNFYAAYKFPKVILTYWFQFKSLPNVILVVQTSTA